ncbi:serine/threonine protein kinase [Lusitaniella coriacea]|nr:serine/threonine-protein kinase [Lusitaniella coriacea]
MEEIAIEVIARRNPGDTQMIGQCLRDRYQIESLLSRQRGRRTFLARDLDAQSPVVIKLLLFDPDFVWDDLKLFEREAETLKSLNHPSIPKYLDSFDVALEWGKGFAFVQNYIDARSLQDWVQSGRRFSEDELKMMAKELLEILDYLHTRQPPVIHRDIKPSNILLRDRSGNNPGELHLVDFGSVQTAIHSGTVTIVGTYGYMPPEQFGGRTVPASDLYSLGATLIYLSTGQHPADLPQKDSHLQFERLVQLSPTFKKWLSQSIKPSLEKRFKSAKTALQALNNPERTDILPSLKQRPAWSRIGFIKNEEELKITFPRYLNRRKTSWDRQESEIGCGGCLSIIASLFILFIGSLFILFLLSIFFAFYPITVCSIFVILLSVLIITFNLATEYYLNREILVIKTKLFGQTISKGHPIPREAICKLEVTKPYFKEIFIGGTPSFINPQIILWTGINPTPIVLKGAQGPEIDWLAAELSNWLGIPIQYQEIPIIKSL